MGKFLPLVAFIVLAWFLYDGLGRDTKKLPSPLIGKPFPNLEVEDFNTYRSEERRVGKECRSRWSPYH